MAASQVDRWFAQASARWALGWERKAFAKHVGKDTPAYPLDLYLAGAAGFRLDAAWEVIQAELGPKTCGVLRGQPIADFSPEELWAETVARLISEDENQAKLPDGRRPAVIIRYRGLVSLVNYFILIARRLGIQRKRQMRPTMSLAGQDGEERAVDLEQGGPGPVESAESREEATALTEALGAAYKGLSSEQQFLIAMVYRKGMKQKDAGKMLGWSEFKTCRSLAAAMGVLREALRQWAGEDWAGTMAGAWEQCVQKCWNRVQVPAKSASKKPAKG